ncbi:MAG: RNA-binding protein [Bacteroidota bacterium]|nr:RNA-binding protein [Bacteroidota bacterium]
MAHYRNSRFVSLKVVLDNMIREMRIGGKMDEMKVRKYWHELMGSYITNHTTRIYYKSGKLFVYLESSALKQELFMARAKIIANLNERLQENLIQELIIR